MTSLDPIAHHYEVGASDTGTAIELDQVNKIYRLYGSPKEQILDAIGLTRLFRRRPTFQEFNALSGIDLTIHKGERVGIIGRNGAGKTTLLKLITGNFAPTTGRIKVNGTVQALMQMGLGFHPEFSGYENIRASLNYNGLSGKALEDALNDVVDFVELGDFLHQPMKTYSLGMNARVQFAAATAIQPDILIVDEILGAGDAYFSGKSAHRMERLTKSGCTLLLVSHSTQQILQFCEKAVWLDRGTIRMADSAIEVVKAYEQYIQQLSHAEKKKEVVQVIAPKPQVSPRQEQPALDQATAEWQKDRLSTLLGEGVASSASGGVSRWPSEKGLKITRIDVLDEHGVVTTQIQSGRPAEVVIELVAEFSSEFRCRAVVLIMTAEGVSLVRSLSPEFTFNLQEGELQSITLEYPEVQLANGDFVFSAGLMKHYDPDNTATATRYDLLSRCFNLRVTPTTKSEPALFNLACDWKVGDQTS